MDKYLKTIIAEAPESRRRLSALLSGTYPHTKLVVQRRDITTITAFCDYLERQLAVADSPKHRSKYGGE